MCLAACAATAPAFAIEPLDRLLSRDPGDGALSRFRLRRVVGFIEANLDEDLSLERLAEVAGLSPSHFARRFKGATGKAPHGYVLAKRVEAARRLLAEGDLPLAQVAAATGFSSQAHLTGVFGRAVGMTPGQYRAMKRGLALAS
ncbi:helix-turn-helix transcriptional regulator [Aerophototrophica crusticola]|uniref:Helix-turn-helix transcriptional regulator n=1 Tax=Aerophototrophica crusticola TaxID=1709002 RepID=A0A858R3J8_9PROT|nr:helix-turn-helix transcriptional regulator [Rhodospirillaceae bacterium B3]